MTPKNIVAAIVNAKKPEAGKKRPKALNPAVLPAEVVNGVVDIFIKKRAKLPVDKEGRIIDPSTKDGLHKYLSIYGDVKKTDVEKILDYAVTNPYVGKYSKVVKLIQVLSSNSEQHYPIGQKDAKAAAENAKAAAEKQNDKLFDGLSGTQQKAYTRLLPERWENLKKGVYDHLEVVTMSYKDYLREKNTFSGTAATYGWSEHEFLYLMKFAACVLMSERRYGTATKSISKEIDYVPYMEYYNFTSAFRQRNRETLKELEDALEKKDFKNVERLQKDLYEKFREQESVAD